MSWTIFFQAFLGALFGGLSQNLYAKSLSRTTTTSVAAITNLIPSFTFVVAVIFRSERVAVATMTGKTKIIGTLAGVGGAMILTFYKGSLINIRSSHFKLLNNAPSGPKASHSQPIFGTILAVLYSLSIAIHYIIQSKLTANYPCHYSNTLLFSVFSFTQSMVAAVISDRCWSNWKLNSKFKLLTAIMQGICSMIAILLMTAVVHRQGPLFASSFNPLVLVFATIAGVIALDERLYVGSLLGSIIIMVGLYGVLWAKGKEKEKEKERENENQNEQENDVNDAVPVNIE